MSNYDEVDKHFGEAFRPKPVTLEQVLAAGKCAPAKTRIYPTLRTREPITK